MNNLYQWHDGWMTELEMRQVRQEMEHLRVLKEAGITGNDWPARALVRILQAGRRKLLNLGSAERPSQKAGSKKFAQ